MSKAGVVGPFGSKRAIQLTTIKAAEDAFHRSVIEPTESKEPGLIRLLAICDALARLRRHATS